MSSKSDLQNASEGFNFIFNDDLENAIKQFASGSSPFHLMGTGVSYFLQAALGLEDNLMDEASKSLTQAEAGARQQAKSAKAKSISGANGQFPAGMEWDVLQADAVVLLGLTQALSESYMGYAKCLYSLNSAHGKFTKLYNSVFPHGLDAYSTPSSSRDASVLDLASLKIESSSSSLKPASRTPSVNSAVTVTSSLFGRWTGSSKSLGVPISTPSKRIEPDGPVDELILSGTAFGYGLFNLIFSLLPPKIKSLVGILGFQSDRKLALRSLAVAATGNDVHSQFAALTLMTYHGVVLLLSGFQSDEQHIVRQYSALLDKVEVKFPHGSLWLLNRAKLQRYTGDNQAAIATLRRGLSSERPVHFRQADAMLVFELAWILLAERQYEDSAETFLQMQKLNNWSHATYSYLAAGCYLSLGTEEGRKKAKEQLDQLPALLERKKIGGRDLPTEVFIRKKIALYKKKHVKRGGQEQDYAQSIKLSPAEELGIVWNTHGRISKEVAEAHLTDLITLTPPVTIPSPYVAKVEATSPRSPSSTSDLELPDEFAARSLLFGILHRATGHFTESRAFLEQAVATKNVEGAWLINTALFEIAVLILKVATTQDEDGKVEDVVVHAERWQSAMTEAGRYLDRAAVGTQNLDLGSRLESRIAFLRDEIELKKGNLGL